MPRFWSFSMIIGLSLAPFSAWSDLRLPEYLIRIPKSVETVFVAETSTAEFHHFSRDGSSLKYTGSGYMSIGEEGAGKEKNGDRRTPLGIYFVTEGLDTTRLHQKYGIAAFVLDYPNAWDQRLARTGDGIWVHGVDPQGGKRPVRDTDGCIALPNVDIAALDGAFQNNVTPVIIVREIAWRDAAQAIPVGDELERRLAQWSASLASGDLHAYLSLYDEAFERWQMRKPEWSSLSLKIFAERAITDVAVSDLLILAYPDASGVYLSRFQETITEGDKQTVSTKRLYWRRDEDGTLRIIAEDNG